MPFCARCFGCYIGHTFAFILFLAGILIGVSFLVGTIPALSIAIIGMAIMLLDWIAQNRLGLFSNNSSRFITGIFGSIGIGVFMWTFLALILSHVIILFHSL